MSAVTTTFAKYQRSYPIAQLIALVLLFAYGTATLDGFSSEDSVRSMLVVAALLGLAALGQTLVILIGALDLSVPGMIVLGANAVSELSGTNGWPLLASMLFVVAVCGSIGATVGFICHRYKIMPIVVTLGAGAFALGAVNVWTGGTVTGATPQVLSDLVAANGTTFGLDVAPIVVIWAIIAIIMAVFLHRMLPGRRIYATGANPRAADLNLVKTRKVWIGIFAASAALSGLVGMLLAGYAGTDATLGDPYLFQGLTAVIVGGTIFAGARGDYTHTVLGALILTVLTTILTGHNLDFADQQIIFGVLILIVVAGYGRGRRLRDQV